MELSNLVAQLLRPPAPAPAPLPVPVPPPPQPSTPPPPPDAPLASVLLVPLPVVVAAVTVTVLLCVLMAVAFTMRQRLLREWPCLDAVLPTTGLLSVDDSDAKSTTTLAQESAIKSPAGPGDERMQQQQQQQPHHENEQQQNDDDDRRRLRERIAGLSAEDRTLQAQRAALEGGIESTETAEAAEAAVSAAGSPEAALLAAVSRAASPGEVRALLRRGANPDAAFLDRGALAVAARSCALGVVKVLVDSGATLDMKDSRGWTPLMHAIDAHSPSNSREGVLSLLLDAGAAVDVWGNDLTRPIDLLEAREAQQARQALALQVPLHDAPSLRGYSQAPPQDLAHLIRQRSQSGHVNELGGRRLSHDPSLYPSARVSPRRDLATVPSPTFARRA